MEQLNRVELRGIVGSSRITEHSGRRVNRFSVATSRAYRDPLGNPKIDTTWHNVNAWEGRGMPQLELIQKGSKVEVQGRIRNTRFQMEDGIDRFSSEIQAIRVSLIGSDVTLSDEM